mgnify:CR=1 FL=1
MTAPDAVSDRMGRRIADLENCRAGMRPSNVNQMEPFPGNMTS